jgi:putative ABC transport system permease protein
MHTLIQDLRFALRQMRRSPAFTLLTTLILTLGIGINTAIFSLVYHILLEPLPFPQPDQLYAVWARSDAEGNARIASSGPDFLDYHDQTKSFSKIAVIIPHFTETWNSYGEPKLINCTGVSQDFFSVLGIRPYMGRFYTSHEYEELGNPTILVSYRFWKSQLGGDSHVLGRVIQLGGSANTIVGVVPPLPDLFPDTEVWPTLPTRPGWEFMQWRKNKFLTVMGRLKPGVAVAQAQAELTGVLRRAPGEPADIRVQLIPLKEDLVGSVRTQLHIVLAAVALVLLVACVNVAGLLLARSAKRSVEMAVRLSLGASLKRLQQQVLAEGLALTIVACSPGVFAAWLGLKLLPRLPALGLPRLEGLHLNGTTLLVTAGVAVLTTILFGWAPSLMFSRPDLASSLRSGWTNTGKTHHRSFSALIIVEIACSVVLSICAGLLLESYWRLAHVDSGFDPDHMLTTYLRTNYYTPEGRSFWRDVLQGVGTLPGVRAAALADCTPGQEAAIATLMFRDRANDPNHAAPAEGCWTSADFFRVSGTPLIRGRFFGSSDTADSAPVAIINEQAARRYWPGQDPIGKLIAINYTGPGRTGTGVPRLRTIVGVVQGMKYGPPESATEPAVYMPYLQDETNHDMASMSLFVRTDANPLALDHAIRQKIHSIRPEQPVDRILSMQDIVSSSIAQRRYSLSLLAAFAALALLLAAVGIYGIVSWSTLQRTREFGIRIAVGATRGNVMAVVFREGLILTLVGAAIGVGVALLMTRALVQLLFEISPLDATSFCSPLVVLGLLSMAACLVPALRSAYLDPVRALSSE